MTHTQLRDYIKKQLSAGGIVGDFTIDVDQQRRLLLINFKDKKDSFLFEMKFGNKALLKWYFEWIDTRLYTHDIKAYLKHSLVMAHNS